MMITTAQSKMYFYFTNFSCTDTKFFLINDILVSRIFLAWSTRLCLLWKRSVITTSGDHLQLGGQGKHSCVFWHKFFWSNISISRNFLVPTQATAKFDYVKPIAKWLLRILHLKNFVFGIQDNLLLYLIMIFWLWKLDLVHQIATNNKM